MGRTWNEKLTSAKPPHIAELAKTFAGLQPGEALFVPSPLQVRDYMLAIPYGEQRTIAAEAAWEDLQAGRGISEVTPFWRLIDADSAVGRRLTCGADFIETTRANEARLTSALAAEVPACTT